MDLGGLDKITASAGMFSTEITYDYLVQEGRPLGDIYGYINDGMYTIDDFDYNNGTWTLKKGVADASKVTGIEHVLPVLPNTST